MKFTRFSFETKRLYIARMIGTTGFAALCVYTLAAMPSAQARAPDGNGNIGIGRAEPLKYKWSVSGLANGLLKKFQGVSDLEQLRSSPPIAPGELDQRVQRDIKTLNTILRAEGYYEAEIDYRMNRTRKPIMIRIDVTPGSRFKVKSATIRYADSGFSDSGVSAPAFSVLETDMKKLTGTPARAEVVVATEDTIMQRLAEMGYPLAKKGERSVIVDHADHSMTITYHITPGPYARFDGLTFNGLTTVRESYLRRLVPWHEGETYDQAQVDLLRSRLATTGLFASIRMEPGKTLDADGRMPVAVDLRETRHRSYGAGANYSSSEGFGAEAFWEHRNLFGRQERLRLNAKAGQNVQALGANFTKPNFRRLDQKLLADVNLSHETPDAFEQYTANSTVAIERQINPYWAASVGGTVEYSRITDANGTRNFYLAGIPLSVRRDTSNSLLDPTSGSRLAVSVQPYTGLESGSLSFVRSEISGSAYFSLDQADRFVLAGRVKAGSIVGAARHTLPANKRFYAGGGASVRGYRYQSIGPKDVDGNPRGGRSLFEAGAEVRVKITKTIGIVPFIEAGSVYSTPYPDFSRQLSWGAGLGFRYYTDFAPFRVDIAVPLNKRPGDNSFQVYVSLGQSF